MARTANVVNHNNNNNRTGKHFHYPHKKYFPSSNTKSILRHKKTFSSCSPPQSPIRHHNKHHVRLITPPTSPEQRRGGINYSSSTTACGEKTLIDKSNDESLKEFIKPNNIVLVTNDDHQAKIIDCFENSLELIKKRKTIFIIWDYGGWKGEQAQVSLNDIHPLRHGRHRLRKQTLRFPMHVEKTNPKLDNSNVCLRDYYDEKHINKDDNNEHYEVSKVNGHVPCDMYGRDIVSRNNHRSSSIIKGLDAFKFDLSGFDDTALDDHHTNNTIDGDGNMEYSIDPLEFIQHHDGEENDDDDDNNTINTDCTSLALSKRNDYKTYYIVERITELRSTQCNTLQYRIKWRNIKYNNQKPEWLFYDKLNPIARQEANIMSIEQGLYDPLSDFDIDKLKQVVAATNDCITSKGSQCLFSNIMSDDQKFTNDDDDIEKNIVDFKMSDQGWSGLTNLSYTFTNKRHTKYVAPNECPNHPKVVCLFPGLNTTCSTFQKAGLTILKRIQNIKDALIFVKNDDSPMNHKIHHVHLDTRCIPYLYGSGSDTYDKQIQDEINIFVMYLQKFRPNTGTMTLISKDQTHVERGSTYIKFHCQVDRQHLQYMIIRLLNISYHIRICPMQSELYGSTQKCIRYVIYCANANIQLSTTINIKDKHNGNTTTTSIKSVCNRVHKLPLQWKETHTKQKDNNKLHIQSSSSALKSLSQFDYKPVEDPTTMDVEIPDHVMIHPSNSRCSLTTSSYKLLNPYKPWHWTTNDFPLFHYSKERLVTIREYIRLLGIKSNYKEIPWNDILNNDDEEEEEEKEEKGVEEEEQTHKPKNKNILVKKYEQILRTLPVECAIPIVDAVRKTYGI